MSAPEMPHRQRGVVPITMKTCGETRAQSLVESGLVDLAAGISSLATSLTDAAITSIQNRMAGRGCRTSRDEVEFLREAVFHGIAYELIEKVKRRFKAELQRGGPA